MTFDRLFAAVALFALLPACKGEAPQEGEVTGEVLEGTISDDMLPFDQLRSEAPLADPTGTARAGTAEPGDAGGTGGETEAEPADPSTAEPADEAEWSERRG